MKKGEKMNTIQLNLTSVTSKLYGAMNAENGKRLTNTLRVIADLADRCNLELSLFPNLPKGLIGSNTHNSQYPGDKIGEFADFDASYSPRDGQRHSWRVKVGNNEFYAKMIHHYTATIDSWGIRRPEDGKFVFVNREPGKGYTLSHNNTGMSLESLKLNSSNDICNLARIIGAGNVVPYVKVKEFN
jgi:hypothetical protein